MRLNVYSQELTHEVLQVDKRSNTGIVYHAGSVLEVISLRKDLATEREARMMADKKVEKLMSNSSRTEAAKELITYLDGEKRWMVPAEKCAAIETDLNATEQRYRHRKGGTYRKIADAKLEADQSPVVVYMAEIDGTIWVRPAEEFNERFTLIK